MHPQPRSRLATSIREASLPFLRSSFPLPGTRSQRDAAVRLLGLCLADTPPQADQMRSLVEQATVPVLVSLARYHAVAGIVHERLAPLDVPEALLHALAEQREEAVRRHLLVTWALARLQPVLDASPVPWAVVKGPVLAELHGAPGRRSYRDLDLLVDPAGFADVLERLQAAGGELLDSNWRVLRRELRGELHLGLPGGVPLDLHWSLINMYRASTSVDSAEMLARRVSMEMGGVRAWSLEPTDRLVHVAVHGALSGADRLMWMKDLDLATRAAGVDWRAVVERSERWHVARPVGLMLHRTALTLGTPLPRGLVNRVLGRRYRRIADLLDRFSPWQHALGRVTTPSLLLARSIGQGPMGTVAWLARRTVRNLDPREPAASSAFTPSGTDDDRLAYLAAVTAVADPARRSIRE